MKVDPDTQHMVRFRDGDQDAFRILFTKYKRKIINFCFRFCGDKEMSEELAQEVFLRVYKAAPRYRPDANFSTWIFRIATNVCLNEVRKKKYNYKIESLDTSMNSGEKESSKEIEDKTGQAPQDLLEDKERHLFIQQAISNLPEKQRAALLLRIYHGFSYQEIGRQIKKTEKGVKSLIHRGRQNLKNTLQEYY